VNHLAGLVAAALGLPANKTYLPARNEVHVAYADHARAAAVFPEITHTPLAEGLATMAAWARGAKITPSRSFEPIEIEAGLPPSWRA
jgi:hypothetical protein